MDQREIANVKAFKEAGRQITSEWKGYSNGSKDWPDIYSYLSTKGLKLNRFNQFRLLPGNDTSIEFYDNTYILVEDTIFYHSILYGRKNWAEISPTPTRKILLKKIDTNLYYYIISDYSP